MTASTTPDQLILDWLNADRGALDPAVVAAAVVEARARPQRSRRRLMLVGPAPWPSSSRFGVDGLVAWRWIAVLLAVAVALIAGAVFTGASPWNAPRFGPIPTLSPRATWISRDDRPNFGPSGPARYILDLPADGFWASLDTTDGFHGTFASVVSSSAPDELTFRTVSTILGDRSHFTPDVHGPDTGRGCLKDDVGHYRWSMSEDGSAITLTALDDQCPARSAAFAGAWLRQFPTRTDGGTAVVPGFMPEVAATLPEGAYDIGYTDEEIVISGRQGPLVGVRVVVVRNPGNESYDPGDGAPQPGQLIADGGNQYRAYFERHALPGESAGERGDHVVAGIPAVHLGQSCGVVCADDGTVAWSGTERISMTAAEWASVYLFNRRGDTYLVALIGPRGAAGGPAFADSPLLDSIRFVDDLPAAPSTAPTGP